MNLEANPMANRRDIKIVPLTARQIEDAERGKVYVYNVSPREYRTNAIGKMFVIPACPEGADISEPLVVKGIEYQTKLKSFDGLDKEFEWYATDGIKVAEDIVGTAPFKHSSENLTLLGVFISTTEIPSSAAIEAAREQWLTRCSEKVRAADNNFAVNNGMVTNNGVTASNISEDDRRAAKALGIKRPWADKHLAMKVCDECGESNMPTAARCKNAECRAIFDEEAARRKFPEMFSHENEPVKRGPGRPPREVAA